MAGCEFQFSKTSLAPLKNLGREQSRVVDQSNRLVSGVKSLPVMHELAQALPSQRKAAPAAPENE
jgi:hypothetical protein